MTNECIEVERLMLSTYLRFDNGDKIK